MNPCYLVKRSLKDHNAWTGSASRIAGQNILIKVPKHPVLLPMTESLNQPVKEKDIGYALNGVAIFNPYNMQTCCDASGEVIY